MKYQIDLKYLLILTNTTGEIMSYDLYFTNPMITREDFYNYFEKRKNYKVENNQAIYQNEDTGVYFIFEFNDNEPHNEDEIKYSILLNINYYRPVFFGLEAEPEIESIIKYFNFEIFDGQNDGMGTGPYSKEGFLKSWNAGNEFGYCALLQAENHPKKVYARHGNEILPIWKWNLEKHILQNEINKDLFIPRIFFITINGALKSTIVWPDGISTLIPKVDCLYIPRKELAQRKMFIKREDKCIIDFNEAYDTIKYYKKDSYCITAFELPYPETPKEIKLFVSSLEPNEPVIQSVAMDSILDLEIVSKYNIDTEITR